MWTVAVKSSRTWTIKTTIVRKTGQLFDPGQIETASDKGVGVGHLLNHLAGGFAGAVARLCVHEDEEGVWLFGGTAHGVLQGCDVLERVEGHHPVIVVPGQQEDSGILDPIPMWDTDVVERRVSGTKKLKDSSKMFTITLIIWLYILTSQVLWWSTLICSCF